MHFGAVGAFDHVPVRYHPIDVDEKAAAARQLFAARIEGFDRHGGRFDATNQFGKLILRKISRRNDEQEAQQTRVRIVRSIWRALAFIRFFSITRDDEFCAVG